MISRLVMNLQQPRQRGSDRGWTPGTENQTAPPRLPATDSVSPSGSESLRPRRSGIFSVGWNGQSPKATVNWLYTETASRCVIGVNEDTKVLHPQEEGGGRSCGLGLGTAS